MYHGFIYFKVLSKYQSPQVFFHHRGYIRGVCVPRKISYLTYASASALLNCAMDCQFASIKEMTEITNQKGCSGGDRLRGGWMMTDK